MTKLIIKDLENETALDKLAMSGITGGSSGGWVFGWINPYSNARSGVGGGNTFINPVFNIQYANQTINGDGPITAINAPVSAPSTVLNENISLTNIENHVANLIGSAGNTVGM